MLVSAEGRDALTAREGRRLLAYRDTKGVLTIGVGHTGRMSAPPVTAGMKITAEQCDAFLAADLAPVEAAISRAVKVPLGQNECDALASLAFNIGAGSFEKSTVVRKLNLGDVASAADAFLMWNKPAELKTRRESERAQFLKPDPMQSAVATARGKVLAARASSTSLSAGRAAVMAATAPVAGAAMASASIAVGHPIIAASAGLVTLLASAILAAFGWQKSAASAAMAKNAAVHLAGA